VASTNSSIYANAAQGKRNSLGTGSLRNSLSIVVADVARLRIFPNGPKLVVLGLMFGA
jgi:hypothetical protein